jgi:hypothetical protein
LTEGYYVVFSQKHAATDTLLFDETVAGKRIRTYIIRTNFEPPSRRTLETAKPKRQPTRRKKAENP